MDQPHDRSHLPHALDGGLGARARIGLIVLATDQTIEHEWRLIFQGLDGVALYQSRIWNDPQITPETLLRMEGKLAESAAVIMPGLPLASLAFGCTSATMVIGEEGVFARLREARPEARPTTPDHRRLRRVPRLRGQAPRRPHPLPRRRQRRRPPLHRGARLRGAGLRLVRRGGRPPRRPHLRRFDPRRRHRPWARPARRRGVRSVHQPARGRGGGGDRGGGRQAGHVEQPCDGVARAAVGQDCRSDAAMG